MESAALQLLLMCLVMLAGSYGIGSLPLFVLLGEERLHLVSIAGAGLLVGVAFTVIIPEGVETLVRGAKEPSWTEGPSEGLDQVIGLSLVLGERENASAFQIDTAKMVQIVVIL